MAIREIIVEGYRSIRRLRLGLQPITVVTGPNGSGKSNLYRALTLIAHAARGRFARTLALEGGPTLRSGRERGIGTKRRE